MVEVTLPRNSSYSQLNTMTRCGMQWFLERGLRVPSQANWAMVGGSAVHTATEQWDLGTIRDGDYTSTHEHANALFETAFENEITERMRTTESTPDTWRATGRRSKEWPDKKNEKWWRVNGPIMVLRWMNWRSTAPWEIAVFDNGKLGIEVEIEAEIAGLPIHMYLDRVFTHMGEHFIVDLKSGDRAPDDATQLGVYAEGMEQQYGFRPRWGAFWMAGDGGTTPPVDLDKWTSQRLAHSFGGLRAMQEQGIFLPHVTNMCVGCGVRDYCYAVDGELAHTVPSPWEVSIVKPLDIPSDDVS